MPHETSGLIAARLPIQTFHDTAFSCAWFQIAGVHLNAASLVDLSPDMRR